jgi:NADPH:quinone reductase-like Zn-dependent oxidoreductase
VFRISGISIGHRDLEARLASFIRGRTAEKWRMPIDRGGGMRAIVQERYGSPDELELREVPEPAVGDDDVLVRIRATSVHADVWHAVRGVPYVMRPGRRKPKEPIPGTDLAGVVESVGRTVTRFQPGDEVIGQPLGATLWRNGGTFAELAAVPEERLEPKPPGITFEEAAAVLTSGPIAVQAIRDEGRVRAGQRVLINGAGGAVGTIAVQLAKAYGAEVTAVDGAAKLDKLRSIGADHVIDHMREDFTRMGERYDVVVDIPGNHRWSELQRALAPEGTYVLIGHDAYGSEGRRWIGSLGRFCKLALRAPFDGRLHPFRGAKDPGDRLKVVLELVEAGKITPVIDSTYPLDRVVDAIRHLETGQPFGKIVITV